jgi:hypothetical protein
MGKLQTAVNLPKRILLQGWANEEDGLNINGEYTYTINFDISIIIGGGPSILYNGYKHNTLNAFIYFAGAWQFLTTADPNQWDNPSTNNVLPLTGWIENNAQGPAGTITILENISGKTNKISIKKQNTGGGKIIAPRKSKYELILTISPTNEVYKIYTDNIDPIGFERRTSKNEYNIEIIKDEGLYWYVHFRNINDGAYCNSFRTSYNSPADFTEVDWDIYSYNQGCPNLNYTRLDIIINQRY